MAKRLSFLSIMMPVWLCFAGELSYATIMTDFANPPLNRRTIAFADGANQEVTTYGFGGISDMGGCTNWNTPEFFAALNLTCDTLLNWAGRELRDI